LTTHLPLPSLELIRQAAARLGGEIGARLIVLFGSAARAGEAPRDLDVGVLTDGPFDPIAATNRLIQLLRVQQVDVTDLRRADPLLLALAARDGVALFEGAPGAFAAFASLAARRFADTRKFRDGEREEVQAFVRAARERG
jgi:predicted nucleotidyltransferase